MKSPIRFPEDPNYLPVTCPVPDLCATTADNHDGIRNIHKFGPSWMNSVNGMWRRRWYPTPMRLSDGRIFIAGGDTLAHVNPPDPCYQARQSRCDFYLPERDFTSTTPEAIPNLDEAYPMVYPAPSGNVFYASFIPKVYDTVSQVWEEFESTDVGYEGSSVAVRPLVVLRTGGYLGSPALASPTAWKADLRPYLLNPNAEINWEPVSDMIHPRARHNLTVLPNGMVLAVGGFCGTYHGHDDNCTTGGVGNLTPEIYNIDTDSWTAVAAHQDPRFYHSSAVLMYDGRVLVAGGGFDSAGDDPPDYPTGEIYSPAYLFDEEGLPVPDYDRLVCINNPNPSATYNATFDIKYYGPTVATRASMMGVGASTHHFDPNQRYVPIAINPHSHTQDAISGERTVALYAPAAPDSVPPGTYMLFLSHEVNGRRIMGKSCYLKLSDGKTKAIAHKTWISAGTSLQPQSLGNGEYWARKSYQADNQYLRVLSPTNPPANSVLATIEARSKLDVSTSGVTVDALTLYVEHSSEYGGLGSQSPKLSVRLWKYNNTTPDDTTGAWVDVGAGSYASSLSDQRTLIEVPPSLLTPLSKYIKRVTNDGTPYYRIRSQATWRAPTTGIAQSYELKHDFVGCKVAYH